MDSYMGSNMSSENIYIWAFVALIILTIAWLNGINLSLASVFRTKGVLGIKKVVGASRQALWIEYFRKYLLINLVALFLSVSS
jgi:putative ABC transport system permease protein